MRTPLPHWPLQLSTTGDVVCARCGTAVARVGEVFTPDIVRARTKDHRRECGLRTEHRAHLVPRSAVRDPDAHPGG